MKTSSKSMLVCLPKTGQDVEYYAGDDGTYQSGWWRGTTNESNRTRFIFRNIDGDDVVIDRATGLMWPKNWLSLGGNEGITLVWENAIAYCNDLNFAGFTDWCLPNINELLSLVNYKNLLPGIWPDVFQNVWSRSTWTSTTSPWITSNAYIVDTTIGGLSAIHKLTSLKLLACRLIK